MLPFGYSGICLLWATLSSAANKSIDFKAAVDLTKTVKELVDKNDARVAESFFRRLVFSFVRQSAETYSTCYMQFANDFPTDAVASHAVSYRGTAAYRSLEDDATALWRPL